MRALGKVPGAADRREVPFVPADSRNASPGAVDESQFICSLIRSVIHSEFRPCVSSGVSASLLEGFGGLTLLHLKLFSASPSGQCEVQRFSCSSKHCTPPSSSSASLHPDLPEASEGRRRSFLPRNSLNNQSSTGEICWFPVSRDPCVSCA